MSLNCPNCQSPTAEIRECDRCGKMGCPKCLKKTKNEWVCIECKNGSSTSNNQTNIFSMFE